MDADIRRKLARGLKVRDFTRMHPSDAPGHTETAAQLEQGMARAEALATQQQTGYLTARAAGTTSGETRETILEGHIRHVVRIGKGLVPTHPELAGLFQLPPHNTNLGTFIASAKALADQAAKHPDVFLREGLPESFLSDFNLALEKLEAAETEREQAKALHVGARAELSEVLRHVGQLVARLNGINRYRFKDDPEMLAAWDSARIMTRRGGTPKPEPQAAEVTPPSQARPAA